MTKKPLKTRITIGKQFFKLTLDNTVYRCYNKNNNDNYYRY